MPLPSSHYSIVWAWTAVPLFIESDGTMLHLNLIQLHGGFVCPAWNYAIWVYFNCHHLYFLHPQLFSIQISVPKTKRKKRKRSGSFELEVWCSILKQQLQRLRCLCEVQMPPENSVILYLFLFLFVCLFVWLWWSRPYIYFCMCIRSLRRWVQFYKTHKPTDALT